MLLSCNIVPEKPHSCPLSVLLLLFSVPLFYFYGTITMNQKYERNNEYIFLHLYIFLDLLRFEILYNIGMRAGGTSANIV